ncbi:MAG: M20 family metallo-hydrolase [Bacteroidaceae bacterium]|nr:M20 family metallo-hydrolase [Bacteroidaceae bacterium]
MKQVDYVNDAVELLKTLIAAPSISREEDKAADALIRFIIRCGLTYKREVNNVWIIDPHYDENRPNLLLNAHLDTVKAVDSWTRHPFTPTVEGDTIYGLGSNDCGGGLVSLLQVFRMLIKKEQEYNVIYLASAEEEISGKNGIERVLPILPPIDVAVVGEPTGLRPAIAEKGLMVLDVTVHGKSGHAARNEGVNAIYQALDDIQWFRNYTFPKNSEVLGPTNMNVTMISAGTQHNVIPDKCTFTVDIRSNENYTNKEIYDFICKNVKSEVKARSFRLSSSHININHPLIRRALEMKLVPFGSPTLSDQALMSFPSFKLGPGESCRSHCADEFIRISEIDKAIDLYFKLFDGVCLR